MTHTHTHTRTYTHLPLCHRHTLVIVTDTHQNIDRGLYTYMTSYLAQAYRLWTLIDKPTLFINSWLIRLWVDNVLLINTRSLSILIDKSIPLSIGISTEMSDLESQEEDSPKGSCGIRLWVFSGWLDLIDGMRSGLLVSDSPSLSLVSAHSGAKKAHDWAVEQRADLFRTTQKKKKSMALGKMSPGILFSLRNIPVEESTLSSARPSSHSSRQKSAVV